MPRLINNKELNKIRTELKRIKQMCQNLIEYIEKTLLS